MFDLINRLGIITVFRNIHECDSANSKLFCLE